jgi:hypothetical protein
MAFIHLENGMQSVFWVNKMVDVVDKKVKSDFGTYEKMISYGLFVQTMNKREVNNILLAPNYN